MNGKLGFIGVGNMAGAILNGIISSGIQKCEDIVLFDLFPDKMLRFKDEGCKIASSECELVKKCDSIILAIKPQGFKELLDKIKDALDESKLIISIAAGISIDYINCTVGKNLSVVRVLPNTPMIYGYGVSAVTYRAPATEEQYEYACNIFRACGSVYYVEEEQFDSIIAVHSSSPAYVFLFLKAMADSAEKQGIERSKALEMITGTFIGASKMVEQSALSCDELISMVASKGGTTEASLAVFNREDICGIIDKAMIACTQRAVELGKKE